MTPRILGLDLSLTTIVGPRRNGARPVTERLTARTDRRDPSGCWVYTGGGVRKSGHRDISHNGRMRLVHRVAWELANGPIPEGKLVCHHCDNPPCVNPAHLYIGTPADNNRDRDERGRHRSLPGERHGMAKLNDDLVRAIRDRAAAGETGRDIARSIGVHRSTVSLVIRRKTWKHVPDEIEGAS